MVPPTSPGRFEIVARMRPIDLVAPGMCTVDESYDDAPDARSWDAPPVAPYAAIVADLDHDATGRIELGFTGPDGLALVGWYDGGRRLLGIDVTDAAGTTHHRSRRHGRPGGPPRSLATTLTGTHLTVLEHDGRVWTARAGVDLADRIDTRDETLLGALRPGYAWHARSGEPAPVRRVRCGPFGQLGFRDTRLVTHADGTAYTRDGLLFLTATSAGPGFFGTGHASVWAFDPKTLAIGHRANHYFRRHDRPGIFGDHASHLVRHDDRWLLASCTWGDFVPDQTTRMGVTLAESTADLLQGEHVLDTRPLDLPTGSLTSVGTWDPHLALIDGSWHVAFVNATKFFEFHPALAKGPDLDRLELVGADRSRRATEGAVLVLVEDGWRLLASDGRDNPRGRRTRFVAYDLEMRELGSLDAAYPSNIPWPTITPDDDGWLMVTFDGTMYGGRLLGYGTHGDIIVMRAPSTPPNFSDADGI